MKRVFVALAAVAVLALPGTAFADDHLFNAAHSAGVDERGFANPVANNPSGTSGGSSLPGTVPGLGDPKVGEDTGTPAFSHEALCERLDLIAEGDPAVSCE